MNSISVKQIITRTTFLRTLYAALCVAILSCSTIIPENESWEGIHNNTLRVFIQYEFTDEIDRRNYNPDMNELLLDSGRNRAEIILLSFIRLYVVDAERVIACRHQIAGIIAKGAMHHLKCHEDYYTAFIDFDVKEFLVATGRNATR